MLHTVIMITSDFSVHITENFAFRKLAIQNAIVSAILAFRAFYLICGTRNAPYKICIKFRFFHKCPIKIIFSNGNLLQKAFIFWYNIFTMPCNKYVFSLPYYNRQSLSSYCLPLRLSIFCIFPTGRLQNR